MKVKKINNINVLLNNTKQFHENMISIVFRMPLTKENITGAFLLSEIIDATNEEYKTKRELNIALKKLYGTRLNVDVETIGNYRIIKIKIRYVNDLVNEYNLLEPSLKLLASFFTNPNIKNGKWNKKVFDSAKAQVKNDIITIKEDTALYALNLASQMIGKGSIFEAQMYGEIDELKKFNRENIVTNFNKLLKESEVTIIGTGYFNEDKYYSLIKEYFNEFNDVKFKLPLVFKNDEYQDKFKQKNELADVNQTRLVVGYKIKPMTKFESQYVLPCLNGIFGVPFQDSKLWNKIRKDNGLAYDISSLVNASRHNLFVDAGIDSKNAVKTIELVEQSLVEVKQGEFTKAQMNAAITAYINRIDRINDNISSLNTAEYLQLIWFPDDAKTKKEKIKKVTKEDIVKLAKKCVPDSILVLGGKL